MSIYTEIQKPTRKPRIITEEYRQACRDREQAKSPEQRKAQAAHAAKFGWTPERRAMSAEIGRRSGGRPKGSKNKKPYPKSEAVLNRIASRVGIAPTETPYVRSEETKEKYRQGVIKRMEAGEFKYQMAYRGRFVPSHPEKYDGDPTNVVYRSHWEYRFMSYLDSNSGVVKWSSEEIIVPYFDEAQKKWRRYFPDFLVVVKQGSGTLTQLIEIKPFKECSPPVKSPTAKTNRRYIKESLTYVTNQCKWKAAESYCADRNWKFKVITERDMGILK
jgi:hypothetical protein